MTALLQSFSIFPQIGFASNRNLVSSFGEVCDPFCTVFVGASFIYFSKISKLGTIFSDFSDYRPKKIGFGAWGRFCMFFWSKKSSICLPYLQFSINSGRCPTQVFPMNLPVNMALALFLQQFWNIRFNCNRGIGKIRIFFNWIAYWIAYYIAYCIAYWICPLRGI